MREHFRGMALVLILPLGVWGAMQAQDPAPPEGPKTPPAPPSATAPEAKASAVVPKPISPAVKKGLDWLVEHQLKDGGWGQGDESAQMGGGAALRDKANVADTCVAALALIRSGSTPSSGPYQSAIARAVRYVNGQVESSDSASLAVSTIQGTRVQAKLGPNIDTFLASLLLAEVKGKVADPNEARAVDLALNKVLGKIKAHQKADGSWDVQAGWAPILAQSMAGKGINRAAQNGATVDATLLARTEGYAVAQFARSSPAGAVEVISADPGPGPVAGAPVAVAAAPAAAAGDIAKDPARIAGRIGGGAGTSALSGKAMMGRMGGMGSAGVELYDRASSLAVLQETVNSNASKVADLDRIIRTDKDEKKVAQARDSLERYKATSVACDNAKDQVIARLDDKGFLAGFGSNGGEEFLSYMNIGDSLVQKGGTAWEKWDAAMTANLGRVQNDDGSWSGHHCITGRTFCTSTALLVLLGDRAPVNGQARGNPTVQ